MDPEKLKKLREESLRDWTQAKDILEAAEKEKRKLTAEEEKRWDDLMANYDRIHAEIGEEEKRSERQKRMDSAKQHLERSQGVRAGRQDAIGGGGNDDPGVKERRAAFRKFLNAGEAQLLEQERRALQMDSDTAGGFLVAPQEFMNQLIVFVNDQTWMRKLSNVLPPLISAESLGVPVLDADPADADWTSEIATGSEDTTMKFGKRELRPHPVAKLIKVSQKLLRASTMDPESIIIDRLGYKFAITLEKAYLLGTGSEQPLGVFTASAQGISTARDVASGNTTTAIQGDGLIEAKMSLKANYWPRATWLFHRLALKQIRKLKDSQGQYLWLPYGYGINSENSQGSSIPGANLSQGSILDSPYVLSEYAPSTFTTGLYVGVIGDFSRYWIADALAFQVQRLVELFAATAQVGFIGRWETDGMPVLEEAFARVALA